MRDTYAQTDVLEHRVKAAAALLGVSENTLRTYTVDSGVEVRRASDRNPKSPAVRLFDADTIFRLCAWRREQGLLKLPNRTGPSIFTVDVIKGGTGKSTTTAELGIHLQLLGLRCLLIDLDIQANLTQMLGYEADLADNEAEDYGLTRQAIVRNTLAAVMIPFIERDKRGTVIKYPDPNDLIKKPFGEDGPHLIPSDTFLGDMEQAIANAKGPREMFFRKFIEASKAGLIPGLDLNQYDVVLFDCPPSISFSSTNALAAADYVISPIKLDSFSVKGLSKLVSELNMLEETYQVRPELIILPTHYSPSLTRIGRMQQQLSAYRDSVSPISISLSEEFPKTLDSYLPLTLQKPTIAAATEYRSFAEYMLGKLTKKGSAK